MQLEKIRQKFRDELSQKIYLLSGLIIFLMTFLLSFLQRYGIISSEVYLLSIVPTVAFAIFLLLFPQKFKDILINYLL